MSTLTAAADLSAPPQPHWISRGAYLGVSILMVTTQIALGFAVYRGNLWLAIPLTLILSHFMHGQLIGFHEASHGLLRRRRWLNDLDGVLIGIMGFMSFTLYRAAHQTHHMHLGTAKDEELWPFVQTGISRPARIFAACVELTCGLLFTPFLFLRTFLRSGSPIRSRKVRRRIWAEFALMAVLWAVILGTVAWLGVWKYFLCLYLIPAAMAGNLQSWRKYIEHVGMTGATIRSGTRSIVAETFAGRLFALTLLHEPWHGVHHQRAGLPHAELPHYPGDLEPAHPGEFAPFPSYRSALVHLLGCLRDPRVGPQWADH